MIKFQKVVIKITGLRDWIPSNMVLFHEQRAIASEGIVKYIEDIYFFEVNTKYISSSVVKKSVFFTSA